MPNPSLSAAHILDVPTVGYQQILVMHKRFFLGIASSVGMLAIGLVVNFQSRSIRNHSPVGVVQALHEAGMSMVDLQTKDFPEHGIHLIGPASPLYAKLEAGVSNEETVTDLPPVFLQNTSPHSVVGYRITWECVDKQGNADHTDVSNIISYLFLHGDESDRMAVMATDGRVIGPNSTWRISLENPAQRVQVVDTGQNESPILESHFQRISNNCSKVTISMDGLFFDDGTFLGPDTTAFFSEVQSQMDARYEILSKVETAIESGLDAEQVLRKLEQIANQPMPELPVSPSRSEYMYSFRILFAKQILGMKAAYGTEKAIADVRQQLSKPWVRLQRL